MVWLTDARAPEGMRLYAIGDVHGCLDALRQVHRSIEADLTARPVGDWRIVCLGDYVDRGPESNGVVEYLIERARDEPRLLLLRGNHDRMFELCMAGDRSMGQTWLTNGGVETLESYGLGLTDFIDGLRTGDPMQGKVPGSHRAFLEGLLPSVTLGDYYFVHAGIDPGRSLEDQDEETQLWIRGPFLNSAAEYDAVIVHGHTPVPRVAVQPNRVGIDTGAVFGGTLSCLVLEGAGKGLLTPAGPVPLPRPEEPPVEEPGGAGVLGRVLRGRLPLRFGRR